MKQKPDISPPSKLARQRIQRDTKPDTLTGDPARGVEPVPFVWRQLSGTEKQVARALAVKRLEELRIPLDLLGGSDLEDECSWQILAIAMRNADDRGENPREPFPEPLATDVDELRDLLSTDERDVLITRYMDFEESLDQAPMETTPAELKLVRHLAIRPPAEALGALVNLGTRTLAMAVVALVAELGQESSPR